MVVSVLFFDWSTAMEPVVCVCVCVSEVVIGNDDDIVVEDFDASSVPMSMSCAGSTVEFSIARCCMGFWIFVFGQSDSALM